MSFLAIAFFGFNLWALGLALAAFFVNLMLTSWSIGIFVAGLLLRERPRRRKPRLDHHVPVPAADLRLLPSRGAAGLAVGRLGAAADLCVRGMRALLIDHTFRADLMIEALVFNAVLFAGASWAFTWLLESAREHGSLIQTGE